MNEQTQRTLIFAGVAVVSLVVAIFARPSVSIEPEDFAAVGDQFYPGFEDPNEAKELQVVTFNADTASVKVFDVQFKDGLWRIPSRHNYPADGKEQLAKTAASVIGIRREALAGRFDSQHEEFGVIDPLDETNTALKGRGQRITLKDEDGNVLADYIIGNEVERGSAGGDEGSFYYVRKPGDKFTFIAELDIKLSAKFADWIESDLLQVAGSDLVQITINKYSIDERQGRLVDRSLSELSRETSTDPWKLKGLDEETEQVKTAEVRNMVTALDDLKIVGVRVKPSGLSQDLSLGEGIKLDPAAILDLQSKGFLLVRGPDGGQELLSNEGELIATTSEGVEYVLRFGEVFTGSEEEVEVGFASDEEEGDADEAAEGAEDAEPAEDGEDADDDSSELKKNRYLFVTAQFNESVLKKPEPPVKPEPPPGVEAGAEEPAADEASADGAAGSNEAAADGADAAADDEDSEEGDKDADDAGKDEAEDPAQKAYQEALEKYEADQEQYEQDLEDYEEKVESGREKVADLRRRFAPWYYVISAENFETLRLARSDLVEPKEADESESETELPGPDLPETQEPTAPADALAPANAGPPAAASED